MRPLPTGIYERLLDKELRTILQLHPELKSVFAKLDPEEEPERYAAFVSRVIESVLKLENDPDIRLRICNEILEQLSSTRALDALGNRRLIKADNNLLLEVTPPQYQGETCRDLRPHL